MKIRIQVQATDEGEIEYYGFCIRHIAREAKLTLLESGKSFVLTGPESACNHFKQKSELQRIACVIESSGEESDSNS